MILAIITMSITLTTVLMIHSKLVTIEVKK